MTTPPPTKTGPDRTAYLAEYRETHKEQLAEKRRAKGAGTNGGYETQSRVASRRFFVGHRVKGVVVERREVVISFD